MTNHAPGPWGPQQGQPGQGQWGQQQPPQPPQGQWGQQPPQGQWGQPGMPGPYGGPPPQPPQRQGNPGLAIAAGVLAMLVGAVLYGYITDALETESTWFGLGIAALVAFVMGKIGGAEPALPFVAVLLVLVGVALGQLAQITITGADVANISVIDALKDYSDDIFRGWKDGFEFFDALIYAFAGFGAFGITKNVGGKH